MPSERLDPWMLTETIQYDLHLYPLVLFKARQIERMSTGRLAIFTYTYTRLGLAVPYLSRFVIASKQKTASCLSHFLTSSPFFHSLFSPNLLPHTHIHHSICKFQVPVTLSYTWRNLQYFYRDWKDDCFAAPGRKEHVDQLSTYFWIWFNPKKYFLHRINFFCWLWRRIQTSRRYIHWWEAVVITIIILPSILFFFSRIFVAVEKNKLWSVFRNPTGNYRSSPSYTPSQEERCPYHANSDINTNIMVSNLYIPDLALSHQLLCGVSP